MQFFNDSVTRSDCRVRPDSTMAFHLLAFSLPFVFTDTSFCSLVSVPVRSVRKKFPLKNARYMTHLFS